MLIFLRRLRIATVLFALCAALSWALYDALRKRLSREVVPVHLGLLLPLALLAAAFLLPFGAGLLAVADLLRTGGFAVEVVGVAAFGRALGSRRQDLGQASRKGRSGEQLVAARAACRRPFNTPTTSTSSSTESIPPTCRKVPLGA